MKIIKTIAALLLIVFEPPIFMWVYTNIISPVDMWGWGYSQGELIKRFVLSDVFNGWYIEMWGMGLLMQVVLVATGIAVYGLVDLVHKLVN